MRALPGPLEAVDVRITQWMARYGVVTLRVPLGVVFLWFGVLNLYPLVYKRAPAIPPLRPGRRPGGW